MPTALPSASIPATISSSRFIRQSDFNEFAPILLFSGIGLLAALIAVLADVPGVWL